MDDRVVESTCQEVPEIPDIVANVLLFALDEAKDKMSKGEEVIPFTCLVVKQNLFIESHPGNSSDECFAYARHTVEGALGADAYGFCYDGYINTDAGIKDAIIAEGGLPGEEVGYAICLLYDTDAEGKVTFNSEPAYVGEAPNFMSKLKDAAEYTDEDIDTKYLDYEDYEEVTVGEDSADEAVDIEATTEGNSDDERV